MAGARLRSVCMPYCIHLHPSASASASQCSFHERVPAMMLVTRSSSRLDLLTPSAYHAASIGVITDTNHLDTFVTLGTWRSWRHESYRPCRSAAHATAYGRTRLLVARAAFQIGIARPSQPTYEQMFEAQWPSAPAICKGVYRSATLAEKHWSVTNGHSATVAMEFPCSSRCKRFMQSHTYRK